MKARQSEVQAARAKLLPVVRRAEMLGELMRLKWSVAIGGTHGKTTTTSLVAALLEAGHFDPTVINGGIINNYGTNARLGDGATGWWSRRTERRHLCKACRRPSPLSPTWTPSTSTTTARSRR